jgi:hypothetical protein
VSDFITVITALSPVNKRFVLHPNGQLEKIPVAKLGRGVAQSVHVDNADALANVLREVGGSHYKVIVPGRWRGDDGKPFNIVTKHELAKMLGVSADNLPHEIVEIDGKRYAARYRPCIEPSSWIVLDADSPEGIPEDWAAMDAVQRLPLWEGFLPGIGAVTSVEMRSSSDRVRRPDDPERGPSHIWLRISDPSRLDVLRAHVAVAHVNTGLSFKCPHRSRTDRTKTIGYSHRGLYDLSVWNPGRIVFVAQPDISAAPGYVVDDADVHIFDGNPSLDISHIREPDAAALREYKARSGISWALRRSRSGGFSQVSRGELTWDTEIESCRVVKTLREWVDGMKPDDKLRCEAPFRVSSSEAAFIAFDRSCEPFVYDSGTATTYRLATPLWDLVNEFNGRYALVNESGKALVFERKHDSVLQRDYFEAISVEDFKKLYLNRRVEAGRTKKGEPRYVDAGTAWLEHPERRQYLGGVVCDPSGTRTAHDQLNIWMGFGVEPRPGSWALLQNHLLENICSGNKEHFDYTMKWMARLVQNPAQQGEVAIVLRGGEGTGKGTLAKALLRLLGSHGFTTASAEHLTGRFNGHMRGCVFMFADEALYAGNKRDASTLKAIVTEPVLAVEAKYRNAAQVPNYLHVMMASNAEWVVPASLDSRRFFVLDVSPVRANDHVYFAAIQAELDDGGYAAMLHDLLHYDLKDFNVRRVPVTAALVEQRERTLEGPHAWWRDVLHVGQVTAYPGGLELDWGDFFPTRSLYEAYCGHAKRQRNYRLMGDAEFGRFLTWMGGTRTKPGTTDRIWGYRFGTLEEAREAYCRATGLNVDWPE